MKTNIKQIDDKFRAFVESHPLINSYKGAEYSGDSDNNHYPMLWCAWRVRSSAVKSGSFEITVPVFVMTDNDNEILAAAEVEQLAYDFIVEFEDSRDKYNFWFEITTSLTPVSNTIGTGVDSSTGVRFDIIINFGAARNQPAIPSV